MIMAMWGTRKANGLIQSQSKGLRAQGGRGKVLLKVQKPEKGVVDRGVTVQVLVSV